jgi:UDP-N-acetylmuramoyl-L-alanyl-D-glutamate--2,6-diaminopimelate ligase
MQIKLDELVSPWIENVSPDLWISGIQTDSRKVKPGDLFLAIHKAFEVGQKYINDAIANGAVAVIYEDERLPNISIPAYHLKSLAKCVGPLTSRFFGEPSQSLNVIGITGTNGKTTIAYLLTQAYSLLGSKSYYVGTLGQGPIENIEETGMTTPDAIDLQNICFKTKQQGYQQLTMEVSSHALEQYRVDGIPFKQAIFTNLTHDHLDYHGTIEAYAKAKARLFSWDSLDTVIVNADDHWSSLMLKHINPEINIYRIGMTNTDADVRVTHETWSLHGMELQIESPWGKIQLSSKLLGDFNVYNILTVFTSLMARGFSVEEVQSVIQKLQPPPGRMEVVATHPLVVVDYAHTPDALENALKTLRNFQIKTNAGRLWVIFGCGGDRDKTKRPVMGEIAARLSDVVIVTSDNPRTEEPSAIIEQIIQGIPLATNTLNIVDRKEAILNCLVQALPNDIVLIAGKGHENYQIIGEVKNYFSDQDVVKDYFRK